jgi:hypothetical protein
MPVFMCFIHFANPTTFVLEPTASQACVEALFKPKRKSFIPNIGQPIQKNS